MRDTGRTPMIWKKASKMTFEGPTIEDNRFNHMNNKSTPEVKRNRVEGRIDDHGRP